MHQTKPKAIYVLDDHAYEGIYSELERTAIRKLVDVPHPQYTSSSIRNNLGALSDIDYIISGWGSPILDDEILKAAPNLKAVFYGAGSIRRIVTPEFWAANIAITSASAANAIPVSEYTLSQILFSLKLGWQHTHNRSQGQMDILPIPGAFRSTIGLISMGVIAKRVRILLRNFEIKVLAYDPYMSEKEAQKWDVERVSLEELFQRSSVVSLHSPDLDETKGMIRKEHFEKMLPYATFLNTARSATVNHSDLCDVLEKRPDLWAVLDVTEDASEEERQRLVKPPNVSLTPHIAGSLGPETRRMGQLMLEEIFRFVHGKPLEFQINEAQAKTMA